jgi:hypothetical protein
LCSGGEWQVRAWEINEMSSNCDGCCGDSAQNAADYWQNYLFCAAACNLSSGTLADRRENEPPAPETIFHPLRVYYFPVKLSLPEN